MRFRAFFLILANYNKYKGQEGYLLFVQKTPNSDSMDYIFKWYLKLWERDFNELGWQEFHGSEVEFHESRGKILDESGELKREVYRTRRLCLCLLKIITIELCKRLL